MYIYTHTYMYTHTYTYVCIYTHIHICTHTYTHTHIYVYIHTTHTYMILDLIPDLGRSPGERNGNPLQYSSLENPMDGGAWRAIDQGNAKSQRRLND